MRFIIDYDVASFFYLGIIAFFYFKEWHVKSTQTLIFKIMIVNGMLAAFLDAATTILDADPIGYSKFILYLINIISLSVTQLAPVLLSFYSLIITGHLSKMKRLSKIIISIPCLYNIILIISSPIWNYGIFYIGENHHYYRSTMYPSLYFPLVFYAILIIIALAVADKKIQLQKKHVIIFDIFLAVFIGGCQFFHPEYLLNHTANCISIIIFYLCIESSSQSVDEVTGAIDHSSFVAIMREKFEQQEEFSLIVINLRSNMELGTKFGKKVNDIIILDFFNDIKRVFNDNSIAQIEKNVFVVIVNSPYISRELLDIYDAELKTNFTVGDAYINISHQTAGISSLDCQDNDKLSTTIEYILQHFNDKKETLIIADEEFFNICGNRLKIVTAIERAIQEDYLQVYYQPIHCGGEQVYSLEALARINDPELGSIDPETFIKIAEQEGMIIKLGNRILEKTVQFVSKGVLEHFGIEYVSVNLSAGQCMSKNICDDLTEIVDRYGVDHSRICFEITESEEMEATRTIRLAMEEFRNRGFKLSLDDFGTGYSNFIYLFEFPFDNVKLDKTLLWDSMLDSKKGILFSAIFNALDDLKITCICEGVETEEQIKWLDRLGANLHQGFYYSKPISESKLLEYLLSVD